MFGTEILSLQHLLCGIFRHFFQLSPSLPAKSLAMRLLTLHRAVRSVRWGGCWRSFSVERMGTCAELGCGPNALSGHSKSGDVLGLTNEKKLGGGLESNCFWKVIKKMFQSLEHVFFCFLFFLTFQKQLGMNSHPN